MIRIRFHAIDAPESGQPHGKAAKAALSELISARQSRWNLRQDRYDRLVARVWLDGWTSTRQCSRPAMPGRTVAMPTTRVLRVRKSGPDLGRGLWRLPPADRVAPWEWRQRKSRAGHFTDYSQETVAACVAALGR